MFSLVLWGRRQNKVLSGGNEEVDDELIVDSLCPRIQAKPMLEEVLEGADVHHISSTSKDHASLILKVLPHVKFVQNNTASRNWTRTHTHLHIQLQLPVAEVIGPNALARAPRLLKMPITAPFWLADPVKVSNRNQFFLAKPFSFIFYHQTWNRSHLACSNHLHVKKCLPACQFTWLPSMKTEHFVHLLPTWDQCPHDHTHANNLCKTQGQLPLPHPPGQDLGFRFWF